MLKGSSPNVKYFITIDESERISNISISLWNSGHELEFKILAILIWPATLSKTLYMFDVSPSSRNFSIKYRLSIIYPTPNFTPLTHL